jgi:hypothetical protein
MKNLKIAKKCLISNGTSHMEFQKWCILQTTLLATKIAPAHKKAFIAILLDNFAS